MYVIIIKSDGNIDELVSCAKKLHMKDKFPFYEDLLFLRGLRSPRFIL